MRRRRATVAGGQLSSRTEISSAWRSAHFLLSTFRRTYVELDQLAAECRRHGFSGIAKVLSCSRVLVTAVAAEEERRASGQVRAAWLVLICTPPSTAAAPLLLLCYRPPSRVQPASCLPTLTHPWPTLPLTSQRHERQGTGGGGAGEAGSRGTDGGRCRNPQLRLRDVGP